MEIAGKNGWVAFSKASTISHIIACKLNMEVGTRDTTAAIQKNEVAVDDARRTARVAKKAARDAKEAAKELEMEARVEAKVLHKMESQKKNQILAETEAQIKIRKAEDAKKNAEKERQIAQKERHDQFISSMRASSV